uniref:HMG box domain-containing protein n=1 Tax=Ceratitis capitata TaxID=7213 RepID=W8AX04_CERCA
MSEQKNEDANTNCADHLTNAKSKATNPFFIFLHEFRQNLMKRGTYKTMTGKQICCAAGERWRQMSADEKLNYIVWARKNQQQRDPRLRAMAAKSHRASGSGASVVGAGRGGGGLGSGKSETKTERKDLGTYRGSITRPKKPSMQKRRTSYIK